MIKVAVLAVAVVLTALPLKQMKPEFSTCLSLAACLLILFYTFSQAEYLVSSLNQIQHYLNINPSYLQILMKMVGLTYVAEFASSICKDSGYQAIGGQIELFGKLAVLSVSMPVVLALLETMNTFLN